MNHLDAELVRSVFDSLRDRKLALGRFLPPEESGEQPDVRLLADQVIRSYPWPIGVELRRLFSGTHRELDRGRLDQLFRTIERTMQFVAFVMVSDAAEKAIRGTLEVPRSFRREFGRRFGTISMGTLAWLIRSLGELLAGSAEPLFVREMAATVLNAGFYKRLEFWAPERNEIGHYQINLTQEEIERRCVEYGERLSSILSALSFLVSYKLVTVRSIEVIKPKHQDPLYAHAIDILEGPSTDFPTRQETQDGFSDSQSVLLMKTLSRPREFLNLSPLIIDTRTEVLDSREKFGIRKDIFLFSKMAGDRPRYAGTEITERCDLTPLSSYTRLQEELTELFDTLGGEA